MDRVFDSIATLQSWRRDAEEENCMGIAAYSRESIPTLYRLSRGWQIALSQTAEHPEMHDLSASLEPKVEGCSILLR